LDIIKPSDPVSICIENLIEAGNPKNDGRRLLLKITWELKSIESAGRSDPTLLKNILA
jgi:hypothetical protein